MAHLLRSMSRWMFLLSLAPCASVACGAEPTPPLKPAVLYLTDGDHFDGALEDSDNGDVVRWQCAHATEPFEFPASAVRAAYFPPPVQTIVVEAEYSFELSDGDVIFGTLVALDETQLEIESPRFGRLQIQRSAVRRFRSWDESTAWEYSGPNATTDWKQRPNDQAWLEEAGHLLTATRGASVRRDVPIPQKACLELAISWREKPDFVFVVAADEGQKHEKHGFRFEVWDQTLVAVRESETDADVAEICDLNAAANRIQLQAFIDQEQGTLSVHAVDGTRLAQIALKEKENDPQPLGAIAMINEGGDVRLEQLRIGRWSGQLPPQVDVDQARLHRKDGSIIYGDTIEFQSDARQFIVDDGVEKTSVEADSVDSVVLAPEAIPIASSFRIGFHDGTRVSGKLVSVESGLVEFSRSGIQEPLRFPATDIRSLVGLAENDEPIDRPGSLGRLELDGVTSRGTLVDGKSGNEASCLVWRPRWSATASPLSRTVSGRIVYRDPPPPPAKPKRAEETRPRQPVGVFEAVFNALSNPRALRPAMPAASTDHPHTLFMRAGDRLPCRAVRIDEEGVHFTSLVVETEFVPHAQIKALEFKPNTSEVALDEVKRERLLTVPRIQKNNPPTHLLASVDGDYLRGRLQSMDSDSLAVETRLETKEIARDRLACIIWLHDSNAGEALENSSEDSLGANQIQAVRADGVRLTFTPSECANNVLIGSSSLLGACRVDLSAVDQILLGDMIAKLAGETAYHDWKLQDAIEPRFTSDGEAGGPARPGGIGSALVGKPAPDFRLELLDGGQFRLSEEKGHIVVLDFWASWCGPCIQGMPEMSELVEEFSEHHVKLVAVNLQEDRATVASTLERLQLSPIVVLDIDGAAAEKYEVTAIPQTIVVDSTGNVAGFYIGSGSDVTEQVRETLHRLVTEDQPMPSEALNSRGDIE